MQRVTKEAAKRHRRAEEMLQQRELSTDERAFVLEHWTPRAAHIVGETGAFFTPPRLAWDLAVMAHNNGRNVDLCAGIGHLARALLDHEPQASLTCIELNPAFVEVGRKVVPEATWVQGDVFNPDTYADLQRFDYAVSNPPFGNVRSKTAADWLIFKGSVSAGLMTMQQSVAVILPAMSCDFQYSGQRGHTKKKNLPANAARFFKALPGVTMDCLSVDCAMYRDEWDGTAPAVELLDVSMEHGLGALLPGPCIEPAPALPLFSQAA